MAARRIRLSQPQRTTILLIGSTRRLAAVLRLYKSYVETVARQ